MVDLQQIRAVQRRVPRLRRPHGNVHVRRTSRHIFMQLGKSRPLMHKYSPNTESPSHYFTMASLAGDKRRHCHRASTHCAVACRPVSWQRKNSARHMLDGSAARPTSKRECHRANAYHSPHDPQAFKDLIDRYGTCINSSFVECRLCHRSSFYGSSAESVGSVRRIARQRLDFLRHGSGVQWLGG